MKRLFITLVLGMLYPIASAQPATPIFANDDVTVTPLSAGRWVMETADMTTMYLIEGEREALLIDTGTEVKALDSIVRLITDKPLRVAATHWHPDHAGGAEYFPEVWLHPADTVLLHREPYSGRLRYLYDGDTIDLGGVRLHVACMPGHTPGSIVFSDYESGDCYTGDAFGSGQVWLQCEPVSPFATYVASCRRMLHLMEAHGIERLYCGHYPYVKRPYGRSYIEAMLRLAESVADGTAETVPFTHPTYVAPPTTRMAIDSHNHVMIVFIPAEQE